MAQLPQGDGRAVGDSAVRTAMAAPVTVTLVGGAVVVVPAAGGVVAVDRPGVGLVWPGRGVTPDWPGLVPGFGVCPGPAGPDGIEPEA